MSLNTSEIMAHWDGMIAVARRMLPQCDPSVWEDVAGDAVAQAVKAADRYEEYGGGPYSWLMALTNRSVLTYLRRDQYRRHTAPMGHPNTRIGRATTDAGTERHVAMLDVRLAVSTLQPVLAEYAAHRLEDVDIVDAGRMVGVTRASASRRETAMRRVLRPKLEAS